MLLELAVLCFCLVGCGLTCHNLGKREGVEQTVEHLIDQGLIQVDEE